MPESIGERIRQLRTEQGMTLAELGDTISLSASFLSQIERDKTVPSLSTLVDIARALKVSLRTFFENETDVAYIHRAKRKPEPLPETQTEYTTLTPRSGSPKLEVCKVILPPHSAPERLELFVGEEFGFVLSGELTIQIGDESFVLAAGDSVHYDALQPHSWSNSGDCTCELIWGRAASLQDY